MISFVTVVFNDLTGLWKTIKSLDKLRALGVNFEHIVIDGGSTDGTQAFISTLKGSKPAFFLSENDDGIYDAMNKGLARISGSYVNFLNAGDVLCHEGFEWVTFNTYLESAMPKIVACGYMFKDIRGRVKYMAPRVITLNYPGMPSSHQALYFRAECVKQIIYNIDLQICGDFDFVMQAISKGSVVTLFDEPCVVFSSGGISFQNPRKLFYESVATFYKYCKFRLILPIKIAQLSLSLMMLHLRSRLR
jgi:putative colanic acid biosynthesis glycosyltransferase